MARVTKDKLRAIMIYNPYGLATRGQSKLYIDYMPGENGRMAHYPYWQIIGIGFQTDPDGWWGHYGKKVFDVTCRADKIAMLNEAIEWCYQKYGIAEDQWEKDPFGAYQIKGTIARALAPV